MTTMTESIAWPLTARVAKGQLFRSILIAVICLVFGVWGIYDYTVALPQQARDWHRAEVARTCNRIIEPVLNGSGTTPDQDAVKAFLTAVQADLSVEDQATLRAAIEAKAGQPMTLTELQRLLMESVVLDTQEMNAAHDADSARTQTNQWLITVNLMLRAALSPLNLDGTPHESVPAAHKLAGEALKAWGDLQPPSKFDLQMQWVFILCLPFAPWYAWSAMKWTKVTYQLDEDGRLHMPEGVWPKDDIADIDMNRWMAKSKAWVEHVDGTRVLLDDYVFKGLWKIVGQLALTHHPDAWTADAKPVTADGDRADSKAVAESDETEKD